MYTNSQICLIVNKIPSKHYLTFYCLEMYRKSLHLCYSVRIHLYLFLYIFFVKKNSHFQQQPRFKTNKANNKQRFKSTWTTTKKANTIRKLLNSTTNTKAKWRLSLWFVFFWACIRCSKQKSGFKKMFLFEWRKKCIKQVFLNSLEFLQRIDISNNSSRNANRGAIE